MNVIAVARTLARKWLKPPLHKVEIARHHEVLGTEYGGWPLILDNLGSDSVIYSVGVGEDISFDLAAIERLGCRVEAFDPTPRCLAWIECQALPPRFRFHPVGLGAADGEVEFFEPADERHVSFSDAPARNSSGRAVTSSVKRLHGLMGELGDERIDVLKMDIEGFEYGVIEDVLERSSIRPVQWLVEFHHGMYGKSSADTRRAVAQLNDADYNIFHISPTGREYGFVRRDPHSATAPT